MSELKFPHRRLMPAEATGLGYDVVHVREDDGTVQTMRPAGSTYNVTYGAPSYTKAVELAQRTKEDAA